ncbi:MAG: 2-C-methyl-D-erythritol 4-phosphate cytidylyltransferase [Desulfuromonadales bacterium C00003096]|jgi:2-C-methyl-D-erythritol 4-phosphate cytidylyltransferase|nr:MAG: 2-C-methyl-D-erythritol 4-phosphate cytidylyltransferase [Desulfuromonadales bacterium C00003096]
MSVFVIIPAAGMGRRMGAAVNKQYLPLNGRPILAHTIALFDQHPLIDKIYLITPADEFELCRREVLEPNSFAKVQELVPGGAERQDSVRNGLLACAAGPEDILLIHDGVRPLLQPALIDKLVAEVQARGACLVGVPVKDTIKQVVDGRIEGTPERSGLWQAQTPQAFRYGQILDAYQRAQQDGFRGTDDASLVERLGQSVTVVAGSYRNIKITTPEDLLLARAFLDNPEGACP